MIRSALLYTIFSWMIAGGANGATLVHTNDISGELDPCGCRTNPLGGVIRQSNLLKKLKDPEIVQVDAGDLLFPTEEIPDLLVPQSEMQAEFLIQALNQMHYTAAVPGEKDFALGLKVFEKLRKKAQFQFLAANLARKDGKKFLNSHLTVKSKGENGKLVRVGLFGLVGERFKYPQELRVSSPLAAAQKEVNALKKEADFVIALTHQDLEEDKKLAQKVAGIDLIVGGHTQAFLQTPMKIKSTYLLQSSFRNQYVGIFPLTKPLNPDQYQMAGLDAGYDSPAEAPTAMDDLVKTFKTSIAQLNSQIEAKTAVTTSSSNSQSYQTFPKCMECHLKQADFWRKTAHAMALQPLIEKHQEKNLECLKCHTVGLGEDQGFHNPNALGILQPDVILNAEKLQEVLKSIHKSSSIRDEIKLGDKTLPISQAMHQLTKAWGPVQCENCHQKGGDHPFSGSYSKTVENKKCLECHNPERAPEWYLSSGAPNLKLIEQKRTQVSCPAGDLPDEE